MAQFSEYDYARKYGTKQRTTFKSKAGTKYTIPGMPETLTAEGIAELASMATEDQSVKVAFPKVAINGIPVGQNLNMSGERAEAMVSFAIGIPAEDQNKPTAPASRVPATNGASK